MQAMQRCRPQTCSTGAGAPLDGAAWQRALRTRTWRAAAPNHARRGARASAVALDASTQGASSNVLAMRPPVMINSCTGRVRVPRGGARRAPSARPHGRARAVRARHLPALRAHRPRAPRPAPTTTAPARPQMGHAAAEAVVRAGLQLVPFTLTGYSAGVAVSNIGVAGIPVELVGKDRRQEAMDKVKERYPGLIVVDYTMPNCVNGARAGGASDASGVRCGVAAEGRIRRGLEPWHPPTPPLPASAAGERRRAAGERQQRWGAAHGCGGFGGAPVA